MADKTAPVTSSFGRTITAGRSLPSEGESREASLDQCGARVDQCGAGPDQGRTRADQGGAGVRSGGAGVFRPGGAGVFRPRRSAPWWAGASRLIIRSLPAGRYRAAAIAARGRTRPFVARMSGEHGGALFVCDLGDAIARDAYLVGSYEPQVSQVVARLLRPSAIVVDVGANWGYFTLMAAQLVGRSGRVLALEPDPRMFERLQQNLSLNGLTSVEALPVAAGAVRGVGILEGYGAGDGNRGVSRIGVDSRAAADDDDRFEVGTAPVDALLDERDISTVDLIKIDVEGFEDAVLQGMAAGLAAHRYRQILIELHPGLLAERGIAVDRCCARLREAGYTGWTFDHSPSAIREATYTRRLPLSRLLTRADSVPPSDPWPHMLWTPAEGASALDWAGPHA